MNKNLLLVVEKLNLITNEECVESNILPVEAMKFLEEEIDPETIAATETGNDQEGEEEDLVRKSKNTCSSPTLDFYSFSSILFKCDTTSRQTFHRTYGTRTSIVDNHHCSVFVSINL